MIRYYIFRVLSIIIGVGSLLIIKYTPEISFSSVSLFLVSAFFTIYGLSPTLFKMIFRIDPNENVILESKKDLRLMLEALKGMAKGNR